LRAVDSILVDSWDIKDTPMKKKCGCTGRNTCEECKLHEQLSFWEFDTSYIHIMGDDIGWDPEQGRLNWTRSMKEAEIRKYLIRCECEQCKSLGRPFRWGWIEVEALWCIQVKYMHGFRCPYCYNRQLDISFMTTRIEDLGTPSEEEIERIGLRSDQFCGLDDDGCLGTG
jgi:hypothetical protein